MNDIIPVLRKSIEFAAFNPDMWTEVFELVFTKAVGDGCEFGMYRHASSDPKDRIGLSIKNRGRELQLRKLVESASDLKPTGGQDAVNWAPVLDIVCDNDNYSLQVNAPDHSAIQGVCDILTALKDQIEWAIRVNRALLCAEHAQSWPRALLRDQPDPAFMLSPDCAVRWCNGAALGQDWETVYTTAPAKKLIFREESEQTRFRAAFFQLAGDTNPELICLRVRDSGNRSAILALTALEPDFPFVSPWVHLFKSAPLITAVLRWSTSRPNLSESILRDLYGLTAKEAELAISITRGETLQEFARRIEVKPETVRWHLKKVMGKMDCRKQQDIIHTLLYTNALFSILR